MPAFLANTATTWDTGSTAWMLTSSALVFLMIPGLALFYGGMVRRKNMLNTIMQSFACMAVVGVQWVTIGYSLAFGESRDGACQQTNFLANFLHRLDPRLAAVVDLAGQQGLNIAKMRATHLVACLARHITEARDGARDFALAGGDIGEAGVLDL